jgi:hypothetical protein
VTSATSRNLDLQRLGAISQPAQELAQVVRYETHLMRQLSQSLGHLRQLQQQRQASRLRPPETDYHHPYDFYDDHIYGTPSSPSSLPLPVQSDDHADPLPLSRAQGEGAGG